jgi:predicted ATPase
LLGYPDQALHKSREALTLARELANSYSVAEGLVTSAILHHMRREAEIVEEQAGSGVTLSKEQGFAQFLTMGLILQGWKRVGHGRAEESLAQIRRGLASWRSNGAELAVPYFLALLAEAYGEAGQLEKGLNALTEALTLVDKNDERWWEAELYRLKGELIMQLASDNQTEAEAYFHQALDIARSQQAKSLELRTATSLARLWQSQDKRQDANDLLAPVYGWFTEGFDTKDLKEANALLQELKS